MDVRAARRPEPRRCVRGAAAPPSASSEPTARRSALGSVEARNHTGSFTCYYMQLPMERATPLLSSTISKWLKVHGKVRGGGWGLPRPAVHHQSHTQASYPQLIHCWNKALFPAPCTASTQLFPSNWAADSQAQADGEPEGRCTHVLQADGYRRQRSDRCRRAGGRVSPAGTQAGGSAAMCCGCRAVVLTALRSCLRPAAGAAGAQRLGRGYAVQALPGSTMQLPQQGVECNMSAVGIISMSAYEATAPCFSPACCHSCCWNKLHPALNMPFGSPCRQAAHYQSFRPFSGNVLQHQPARGGGNAGRGGQGRLR